MNSPRPKPNVIVRRDGGRPSADPPSGPSMLTSSPSGRAVSPAVIRCAASVHSRSIVVTSSTVLAARSKATR